jgi:TRAP-type uncharacterized transport system substrate-binding protein
MPKLLRNTLLSVRDLVITFGPLLVIACLLLYGAYVYLDPTPPKRVVLLTGPEGSDYAAYGKRYVAELRRFGVTVELRASGGSSENRRLLRGVPPASQAGKGVTPIEAVDFAFVQGGSGDAMRVADEDHSGIPLVSLGRLYLEPVWLFYREQAARKLPGGALTQLSQLQGWRVNTGGRGSGTSGVIGKLLEANLVGRESLVRSRLEQTPAVVELLEGRLDAVVLAAKPESVLVQMLLRTPGIRLFEFTQAEAYSRRMPFLSAVVLPRGVVDLALNLPPRDMPLIATTTSLLAREDTHPALVQLFVQAAHTIHGESDWLSHQGQFPSAQSGELPLAKEAERYYRNGPPVLQRYLPFWLANLVDRMWVALFSIIAILIPLVRVLPPLYEWRVRSRVFKWYRQLRDIEDALGRGRRPAAALLEDINALDRKVERISVPLSYTDELYALRSHIRLVRERVNAAAAPAPTA